MKKTNTAKTLSEELDLGFEDVDCLMNDPLPDPSLLEYYRRLEKREILWNDEIDDSTLDIALYIKKWNAEDRGIPTMERKPIKIFINSDGGSLDAVMNVIDIIQLSKTPVVTIGMGRVYSAGGLLLMAGHKRYIFPHTSCLIHDGSSGMIGSVGKIMDNLRFTEEMETRIRDFICENTKITANVYDKNYRRDWFLFSEEMIELGIADEIVTDIDCIL